MLWQWILPNRQYPAQRNDPQIGPLGKAAANQFPPAGTIKSRPLMADDGPARAHSFAAKFTIDAFFTLSSSLISAFGCWVMPITPSTSAS